MQRAQILEITHDELLTVVTRHSKPFTTFWETQVANKTYYYIQTRNYYIRVIGNFNIFGTLLKREGNR